MTYDAAAEQRLKAAGDSLRNLAKAPGFQMPLIAGYPVVTVRDGDLRAALDEIARLRGAEGLAARYKMALEQQKPFLAFWQKIRASIFDGISDADCQEWAFEAGLLVDAAYDPAVHGEDVEAEPGETIYVDAPWVAAALAEEPKMARHPCHDSVCERWGDAEHDCHSSKCIMLAEKPKSEFGPVKEQP